MDPPQYSGVLLRTVLAKAGVPMGKGLRGKVMASYVLAKARGGYEVVFTLAELDPLFGNERVVVADDSGLCVDALLDAPGVHSKRWSAHVRPDEEDVEVFNNAYLLDQLARAEDAGRSSRRARYVCAAACVWRDGECVALGETHGEIVRAPMGVQGFGYDPLFRSDDLAATFGEVTHERKASVSHRGRAFRALLRMLPFAVDPRVLAG